MINLLKKETRLSASVLSFLFIIFGLMTFVPGYPILCGAFFITLGIFQSFQNSSETNDIVFSSLLPIAKKDIVKSKIIFSCFIEILGIFVIFASTLVRMTVLKDSVVYRSNALMNANFFSVAVTFLIFGLFNLILVAGFFKTGYRYGKPFVVFIIVAFIVIFLAEGAHYLPGLSFLNSFGFDNFCEQLICLFAGMLLYVVLSFSAYIIGSKRFEGIDL